MLKTNAEKITRAQRAVQSGILPILQEQEDSLMARLIANYRGGALTPQDAYAGVAALAELRTIESKAIRAVADGHFAVQQETQHAR